jgi:hypothetical protein
MADYAQAAEFAAETFVGFLVANAINNVQNDYNDLAVNYFNLYQYQRTFYFNNFQFSGELPFANEQFGITFYDPEYIQVNNIGYFPPSSMWLFLPQFANRLSAIGSEVSAGYWRRYGSRYVPFGMTQFQEVSGTFSMTIAEIKDDWWSYQFRYEEHKRDVLNERRWASQMGSLSYGVKEAYEVERGMGTSFQVMDEAHAQLISADSTMLNGLATFAGYRRMQKSLQEDLGTVPHYQSPSFLTNAIAN